MPKWRKRPIASIDRRDVIDLVDEIIARGAKVMANRTLAWLRASVQLGGGERAARSLSDRK